MRCASDPPLVLRLTPSELQRFALESATVVVVRAARRAALTTTTWFEALEKLLVWSLRTEDHTIQNLLKARHCRAFNKFWIVFDSRSLAANNAGPLDFAFGLATVGEEAIGGLERAVGGDRYLLWFESQLCQLQGVDLAHIQPLPPWLRIG